MSQPSNVAVVVPLPSFDIDPLKKIDEDFFDRAVDIILSEEVSIEESRDEMMEDTIGVSSPFGLDGATDLALEARHRRKTKSKSPHLTTGSSASPTITKKSKSKSSSRIKKGVTVEDLKADDEDTASFRPEKEALEDEHHFDGVPLDIPSAPIENSETIQQDIDGNEETPEDKIFASVDPEKQIEVLQFIASHSFMTSQTRPVQRAARREFTSQVRTIAGTAGLDDAGIDALIELVRKTYLEDREIEAAEDAGSAFGDEVDSVEIPSTKSSHRKRRKSSMDQPEDKEIKKSKKRHSDKHRSHSHDAEQHGAPANGVEAQVSAEISTEGQDHRPMQAGVTVHEQVALDVPTVPTEDTLASPSKSSVIVDLTESPPHDQLVAEPQVNLSRIEAVDAIGDFGNPNKSNSEGAPAPPLSVEVALARAFKDSMPKSPTMQPEPLAAPREKPSKHREPVKESQKEKNKRKRLRRKERNKARASLGAQAQPEENSAAEASREQIPPSTPQQNSIQSPKGSGGSSILPPLDADASKWDSDF